MSIDMKKLSKKLMEAGTPVEQLANALLINGDSLKVLRKFPSNSIDSCVIDGPYGIGFMGKDWDNFNPKAISKNSHNWQEGVDFNLQTGRSPSMHAGQYDISRRGGVRFQEFTYQWAIEVYRILKPGAMLLSFCSCRLYHRMTCGIEDAGFEIRDQLQYLYGSGMPKSHNISKAIDKLYRAERKVIGENLNRKGRRNWDNSPKKITLPATDDSLYWDGWGTGLKPSNEPILLARKPIAEKSVARNVLRFGTGGINIDSCRVGEEGGTSAIVISKDSRKGHQPNIVTINKGRFPSNTIIDEEVAELLGDKAKFFYTAKTSKKERNAGCEHLSKKNHHPTVKNLCLMEYLVKLITPKNGTCIDIFMGSGSTGISCSNQGFGFIGIEREPEYFEIAKARIAHWQNTKKVA